MLVSFMKNRLPEAATRQGLFHELDHVHHGPTDTTRGWEDSFGGSKSDSGGARTMASFFPGLLFLSTKSSSNNIKDMAAIGRSSSSSMLILSCWPGAEE